LFERTAAATNSTIDTVLAGKFAATALKKMCRHRDQPGHQAVAQPGPHKFASRAGSIFVGLLHAKGSFASDLCKVQVAASTVRRESLSFKSINDLH